NAYGAGTTVITASSNGVFGTAIFTVTLVPALECAVQPSNVPVGAPITPAVEIRALDASRNVSTDFNGNVSMNLNIPPGAPIATLSGNTTVAAVSGVAVFANLRIDQVGNYTLT